MPIAMGNGQGPARMHLADTGISLSPLISPNVQTQSPIFGKLPPEIRLLIYQHLLPSSSDVIHLERALFKDKSASIVCSPCIVKHDFSAWEEDPFLRNKEGCENTNHKPCLNILAGKARRIEQLLQSELRTIESISIVALMLTCSKAYSEIRHELYSRMSIILNGNSMSSIKSLLTMVHDNILSSASTVVLQVRVITPLYLPDPEYY
ncbi:hypothetical protein BT63DRAFT_256811 [Microthyrium microscopicum]|uniref:DUF7730 domain-containing protein n=1 Tax=Microthyrium microscopicum TaxID=703497 RepID=A0A6A6UAT5_9PEZI|nr:hypothetical protein BT63DRAFT_256811 [Microthyrium microscopicum]